MTPNNSGYEKSDVKPTSLFLAAAIVIVVLIVIIVAINEFFLSSKEQMVYDAVLSKESAELRDIVAKDAEILNNYKVLDADKGIYQIPIDRAMQVMADESFEARLDKK
jgi:hypothetical protein